MLFYIINDALETSDHLEEEGNASVFNSYDY